MSRHQPRIPQASAVGVCQSLLTTAAKRRERDTPWRDGGCASRRLPRALADSPSPSHPRPGGNHALGMFRRPLPWL